MRHTNVICEFRLLGNILINMCRLNLDSLSHWETKCYFNRFVFSFICKSGLLRIKSGTRQQWCVKFWGESSLTTNGEECDLRFLPAGCCLLIPSLHSHIRTFCKHVWLYRSTFLPSGQGEACNTYVQIHNLAPGDSATFHQDFHLRFTPIAPA